MIIGVPKEIKVREYRVGLTPNSVHELVHYGHRVLVEKNAGEGIGCFDQDYVSAGAIVVDTPEEIFKKSDMIVKVKEPQPNECNMLREGQVLFTFLHLAPDPKQTELLVKSGCIAIAYETVTDDHGGLPLLAPMSEVAGRLSIQAGAHALEKTQGGRGVLLGGVPGVPGANVIVIGGGVVGTNAICMAIGMDANVTVIDKSLDRLRQLDFRFGARLNTIFSTKKSLEKYVLDADLVVGAVLVPGGSAPKLVTKEMLKNMHDGAVLVDVAIDQGGCFETSRATTHDEPTFTIDGVVHYCVANMPGAVPRTSTFALNNATLSFVIKLANLGYKEAMNKDRHLMNGLNVYRGKVTFKAVADALGYDYVAPESVLK